MTKKIFQSIFLISTAILLVCLTLVLGVSYYYFGSMQKRQLQTELTLAATAAEHDGLGYLEKIDTADCRFTYVAADGSVLYDSQLDASQMQNHSQRAEIKAALETGAGESSRYSASLLKETLYCAKRLPDGTVLRISTSRATVLALFLGMLQPILILLMLLLLLSFLLAGHMSKRIMAPFHQLNLNNPLENDAYDELAPLLTHIEQQKRQIQRQKQELANRKNEFYTVIKNMNEGLVLLNQKGMILSINPAAASFFQTDTGCVGKDFLSIERSRDINGTLGMAETEGHSELLFQRNGREYQLNASRIETGGQNTGIVLLVFDITEKVFAERNRREFTANASHELKTPLHSIMGSAELIENGLVKEEDLPKFVGHIRSEAARLVALVQDIIRLSQLDEKNSLPQEQVDLYELAREEVKALMPMAQSKHVTMSVLGSSFPIQGVRQLFHEIIYNLCDNAVKYNVEGGSVTITIDSSEDDVTLCVTDTGIGIPAEHQMRVFERFYRVDKSRSKESGGTGLGLSIVKHAVNYMNGTISLESRPAIGTAITITFPSSSCKKSCSKIMQYDIMS